MRVCVNTHYTKDYEGLAAIVIPNLQWYCDKHNYDLHITKSENGVFHFVKTKDTLNLLEKYDIVFTIELDAMIMNHKIKVEDFIDDYHDIFLCKDVNNYNSGVVITKSTKWAKDFWDIVNLNENNFGDEQNFFEQYGSRYDKIKVLPHPSINSIPYKHYHNYGYINYSGQAEPLHIQGNFQKNDFICHLPGMTLEKRIEIFSKLKEQIVYE